MEFKRTAIADVLLIQPTIFGDDRGYFFESFHQKKFNEFLRSDIVLYRTTNPGLPKECCAGFISRRRPTHRENWFA